MATLMEKIYNFAAKHPNYIVIVEAGCSGGDHLWHIRDDGTESCEAAKIESIPTTRTHRAIMGSLSPRRIAAADKVVYFLGETQKMVRI